MFILALKNTFASGTAEKKLLYILAGILFALGIFYGIFLNKTVVNASRVSAIQDELISTNSRLGELEFEYMKYKNLFTLEFSKSIGLREANTVSYIERVTPDTVLTFRE